MKKLSLFLSAWMVLSLSCEDASEGNHVDEVDPRLEEFAANLADWHCSMDAVCCTVEGERWALLATSYESFDACVAAEKERLIHGLEQENTVLQLDRLTAIWEAHLAYYGTDCDSPPGVNLSASSFADVVTSLYEGQLAPGDTCEVSLECTAGHYCGAQDTCVPLPQDDEACDVQGCAEGLMCLFTSRTCVTVREVGDPCDWSLDVPCPDADHTLTCDSETDLCVPQYEAGAPCVSHNNCRSQNCGEDGLCASEDAPPSVGEQFCQE